MILYIFKYFVLLTLGEKNLTELTITNTNVVSVLIRKN